MESELPLPEIELNVLPTVPFRRRTGETVPETPAETDTPSGQGMDAVKNDRSISSKLKREYVVEVPISAEVVMRTWRSLRRPIGDGRSREVDIGATVGRIGREGMFTEVVTRSITQKKADLLLLVDDSAAMLPFAPVIQPLVDRVVERRIVPGQIYRFRQCPTDYLYEWGRPLRGEPLVKVLGRLNRWRTIVIIVSDAGATSRIYDDDRVRLTGQFLGKVLPSVQQVLWLNPLPRERWDGTTAETIASALGGRMISFEMGEWRRLVQRREFQSEVQLWTMMQ